MTVTRVLVECYIRLNLYISLLEIYEKVEALASAFLVF